MKTSELIKQLKNLEFEVSENEDLIRFKKGIVTLTYSKNIEPNSDWAKVLTLLSKYYQTPLNKREAEKRYRIRLRGFNSSNGHQYLTTDRNGKVFACAWSPHLNIKQIFTQDELNEIRNRPCFKSIAWFDELVARGLEEVEEE